MPATATPLPNATLPAHFEVADLGLAEQGYQQIAWADRDMPVLAQIRERFIKEQPFKGIRISSCAHLTKETAVLAITLRAGGADSVLIASNPITTQDDVVASLVKHYGIPVFGHRGETVDTYNAHVRVALDHNPNILMDDGGDVVATMMNHYPQVAASLWGSTEETTAGITRLKALQAQGKLGWPAIGVNECKTKHLFDNRYGTGQSTLDSIMRACNILLAGKTVVVVGYGWCGRGCAMRAKGLGAHVVVTEIDSRKALEAVMDGFVVAPIAEAAKQGDVFICVTSNRHVIRTEHYALMKEGAILCNAGHMNWEFDYDGLIAQSVSVNQPRAFVEACVQADGRTLFALSQGRLVNLTAAEGHPASVMDMSFANQALGVERLVTHRGQLPNQLMALPDEVDDTIARLKLASMGVAFDTLTPDQEAYMNSWDMGTQ
jgi:adenosylhomocysteinase